MSACGQSIGWDGYAPWPELVCEERWSPRGRRMRPGPEPAEFVDAQRRSGKRRSAQRNGGRHCCQPPLRRAKDMPVFVTWLIEPEGLPTRSRSWLTSSGVAFHPTAPPEEEPDPSTRLRRPRVRWSFDRSGLALSK